LGLCSVWQLRQLASPHSQPGCSFAPVLATPDELGEAWRGGRLHLPLQAMRNGRKLGNGKAAASAPAHVGEGLHEAARLQPLSAGTLLLSGVADPGAAEPLHQGDSLRLDIKGLDGLSLFGAIDLDIGGADANKPASPTELQGRPRFPTIEA
ncbi:MAG: fumarylacetoacetate hydrolase family protein, partial [Paucibacter sp.]|nr:fumarylacetoacetate hydrolase family protein [Roseateles sp.]